MNQRVQPYQEWIPGPPPTLPPPTAADIARQVTAGVFGIAVATAAVGTVGLGVKAVADAVLAVIATK